MAALPLRRPSLREWLLRWQLGTRGGQYHENLNQAARHLADSQEKLLLKILAQQSKTDFGLKHGFKNIRHFADFRSRIPVQTYEDLTPWIHHQEQTGRRALMAQKPSFFARSLGRSGSPKLAPMSASSLQESKRLHEYFLSRVLTRKPLALRGNILTLPEVSSNGRTSQSNIVYGSLLRKLHESMGLLWKSKNLLPLRLWDLTDSSLQGITALRLALESPHITLLMGSTPQGLSQLMSLFHQHGEALLKDLELGSFHKLALLPESLQDEVVTRIHRCRRRAQELRALRLARSPLPLRAQDVWPHIQAWIGHTEDSTNLVLKEELPREAAIQEWGYLSAECRATCSIDDKTSGLPTILEHVFEFVEQRDLALETPKFLGVHELQKNSVYALFVTTQNGLYRYQTNDLFIVDGFLGPLPRLRFVERGETITNLTGEKLHEQQLTAALREAEKQLDLESSFFVCTASNNHSQYQLYYQPTEESRVRFHNLREVFENALDHGLRTRNTAYDVKRKSERLLPIRVRQLGPTAHEAFRNFAAHGDSLDGFPLKHGLQYHTDLRFDFQRHEESRI